MVDILRRYRVHGRVQGVAFRAFVWREARELQIDGWVRNCSDGTVEALAHGSIELLARFKALLERGPRLSRVDRVEVFSEEDGGQRPRGFGVLPDA
jgi:acylphosphatase